MISQINLTSMCGRSRQITTRRNKADDQRRRNTLGEHLFHCVSTANRENHGLNTAFVLGPSRDLRLAERVTRVGRCVGGVVIVTDLITGHGRVTVHQV